MLVVIVYNLISNQSIFRSKNSRTSSSTRPSTGPIVNATVEEKLRFLDSAKGATSNVSAYARLLDSLDHKCKQSRSHIGDMAVLGQKTLKERKNIDLKILRFLQLMDDSIPNVSEATDVNCAETAALLIQLVERP